MLEIGKVYEFNETNPKNTNNFKYNGTRFQVKSVDGNRVNTVVVKESLVSGGFRLNGYCSWSITDSRLTEVILRKLKFSDILKC